MDGSKIRGILAQNIKTFREHRSLSQADLAANSKISIPFLSEIERGNKWPFPDTLSRIAKALNVQIYELFRENTPNRNDRDFTTTVINEILAAQKAASNKVINKYFSK